MVMVKPDMSEDPGRGIKVPSSPIKPNALTLAKKITNNFFFTIERTMLLSGAVLYATVVHHVKRCLLASLQITSSRIL